MINPGKVFDLTLPLEEVAEEAPRSGVWNPFVAKQLGGDQRCAKAPYCYTSDLDFTTSMLPRVALEYGHNWCAATINRNLSASTPISKNSSATGIEFRGRSN